MINVAGGGVRGLSCALYLLKQNHPVTIYESRQEIGNPVRSPGISKTISDDFILKTSAVKTSFGWAFRREWFEKELAKKVTDSGGTIKLKTTAPEDSINCTGGKTNTSGWPQTGTQYTNLVSWSGGITISNNIPNEFTLDSMEEDRFCFQRGDDLVECWIKGKLPRPTQGWLEIMEGEHPTSSRNICVDESIAEGEEIAKNFIHSLQELD
tara:strand:- start:1051 stop:1680 length:630 start_codon:yes stop_codon:yes gene_type:complete